MGNDAIIITGHWETKTNHISYKLNGVEWCVSKCEYDNGKYSYFLSSADDPYGKNTTATQEQMKDIYEKLEREINKYAS